MEWHDDAIVLTARKHGESSAIVTLLTRDHGRYAGLVRGGMSKRTRGLFERGNRVRATWKARLAEHLGSFNCEMASAVAAPFLNDQLRLVALSSGCTVADTVLPEREPFKPVYEGLDIFLNELHRDIWPTLYVKWELGLLQELGFKLDLSCCAATGKTQDLTYVSPKTGRAVSEQAAKPFKHLLLQLPSFLTTPTESASWIDILQGLQLTGFFLKQQIFHQGLKNTQPMARERLTDLIKNKVNDNKS